MRIFCLFLICISLVVFASDKNDESTGSEGAFGASLDKEKCSQLLDSAAWEKRQHRCREAKYMSAKELVEAEFGFTVKDIIIGQGASSTVYLAEGIEKGKEKKFALKIISDEFLKGQSRFFGFEQGEITALRIGRHKNIISLFCLVLINKSDQSRCYIKKGENDFEGVFNQTDFLIEATVCDFCNGPQLIDIIEHWHDLRDSYKKNSKMSEADQDREIARVDRAVNDIAYDCALDISEAAEFIHDKGFIHRDISDNNIYYDIHDDCFKLADFGLAVAADEGAKSWCGTMDMMAPEISMGVMSDEDYDNSIDVWSGALSD